MADSSKAISALEDAIDTFEKACGDDPDCAKIVTLLEAVEREIEASEKPGEKDEPEKDEPDTPAEKQPKTLADAEKATRGRFAQARKANAS